MKYKQYFINLGMKTKLLRKLRSNFWVELHGEVTYKIKFKDNPEVKTVNGYGNMIDMCKHYIYSYCPKVREKARKRLLQRFANERKKEKEISYNNRVYPK